MRLVLKVGESAKLYAYARNPITGKEHIITVEGKICEAANKVGGDAWCERLKDQLKKLGGTVFYAEDVQVEGEGVYIAVSEVNELRRRAVQELENEICDDLRPDDKDELPETTDEDAHFTNESPDKRICARVICGEQACAAYESGADDVILILSALGRDKLLNDIRDLSERFRRDGKRLYLGLPAYIAETNMPEWERFLKDTAEQTDGVEINNWGQIEFGKCFGRVIGGSGMNVLNISTIMELIERGVDEITLSPELKSAQVRSIIKRGADSGCFGVGVFGR